MGRLRLCKRSLRGPYVPADDQPFNRAPPGKYALGADPQRFVLAPGALRDDTASHFPARAIYSHKSFSVDWRPNKRSYSI